MALEEEVREGIESGDARDKQDNGTEGINEDFKQLEDFFDIVGNFLE